MAIEIVVLPLKMVDLSIAMSNYQRVSWIDVNSLYIFVLQNNTTTLHKTKWGMQLHRTMMMLQASFYVTGSHDFVNAAHPNFQVAFEKPQGSAAQAFCQPEPRKITLTGSGAKPTSTVEVSWSLNRTIHCRRPWHCGTAALHNVRSQIHQVVLKMACESNLGFKSIFDKQICLFEDFEDHWPFFMRGTNLQQLRQLSSWPSSRV